MTAVLPLPAAPGSPFAAELAFAGEIAAEAAATILSHAGAADVREKGRADLVTQVDEAVERRIAQRVAARFPGDALVGEETSAGATATGRRWIVDPIDGTTNFVHGHPFVCVSIAFADAAGPAAGVVHAPFLGEVFHAVRGGGAFRNGAPARVSATASLGRALLATGFPFKEGKGDLDAYMLLVADTIRHARDVRRAGSAALDLAYVACGKLDAFYENGLAPWDAAAGLLLVSEAGGRVESWPGDTEPPLATGRVLASTPAVHDDLRAILARHVGRL